MKRLILPLMICATVSANASEVRGVMNCKVVAHTVHTVKDGIPKEYDAIEGSFKKGRELNFNYRFNELDSFELSLKYWTKPLIFGTFGRHQIQNMSKEGKYTSAFGAEVTMTNQNIYFEDEVGSLDLSRYYKSDWSGLLTLKRQSEYVSVSALDCRSDNDQFEEFLMSVKAVM